jgi:hypothetical protein
MPRALVLPIVALIGFVQFTVGGERGGRAFPYGAAFFDHDGAVAERCQRGEVLVDDKHRLAAFA